MPTNKPRINITFEPETFEQLRLFAKLEKISLSACASRMIEDWIDTYKRLSIDEREIFLDNLRRK